MGGPSDPESPDYQPTYDGSTGGGAGSGKDFGADLYYLYKAGRKYFPELAYDYSRASEDLNEGGNLTQVISKGAPYHRGYGKALDMMGMLQVALNRTCRTLDDTGEALIAIADTYVRTDEEALSAFNTYLEADRPDYQDPVADPGPLHRPDYD